MLWRYHGSPPENAPSSRWKSSKTFTQILMQCGPRVPWFRSFAKLRRLMWRGGNCMEHNPCTFLRRYVQGHVAIAGETVYHHFQKYLRSVRSHILASKKHCTKSHSMRNFHVSPSRPFPIETAPCLLHNLPVNHPLYPYDLRPTSTQKDTPITRDPIQRNFAPWLFCGGGTLHNQ